MSIKKNYIYNLVYEMISLLIPVITMPYVSKVLGADGIGINSYTYTTANYFVLAASLGTSVYARREIAYKRDDIKKKSVAFWELFYLRMATALCSFVAYFIFLFINRFALMLVIQGIYIISVILDITWYYQGMENFGKVVIRNSLIKIIGMFFVFLLVKDQEDVALYAFGLAIIPLISNLVFWKDISKEILFISPIKIKPFRHIKDSFRLFIPTIVSQIYLTMDITMIGIISESKVQNGYYEQANKIINICSTIVTSLTTVLSVRIANVYDKGNEQMMAGYMQKSFRAIWCIAIPVSFGIFAIADILIPAYLGNEFIETASLIKILSIIPLIVGLFSVTGSQYLVATNRVAAYTMSIIIGAAVNLPLNLYLIPRFLSRGAAFATVVAEISVLMFQIIYVCNIIKKLNLSDIFGCSIKYCVSGGAMFLVCQNVAKNFMPSYFHVCITVIIGIIIYISILVILKDDMILYYLRMAKNRVLRGNKL